MTPSRSPTSSGSWPVYVLLTLSTAAVYSQVGSFEFVTYDDANYITNNPIVQQGLTFDGLIWALTTSHAGYWHPLTWLSHMVDCQLFGTDPAGHHLVSVGLHILNALLLLSVLRAMTGQLWRSALCAAVFALHPLHVESVAWIAERKDVLSTTFGLLTIGSYVSYVHHGGAGRYARTAVLLGLGLLAKPMLVTLPPLLLLLDYWPLNRIRFGATAGHGNAPFVPWQQLGRLVVEKLPLVALSCLSIIATLMSVARWFATQDAVFHAVPMSARLPTALVSTVLYLEKMVWPSGLAVLYPHPGLAGGVPWHPLEVALAGVVLIGITCVAIASQRRRYLAVGWFWYLGLLVPTAGIIQVGAQSIADRYTYLSMVGVTIMVVWSAADVLDHLVPRPSFRRLIARSAGLGVLLPASVVAYEQTLTWRNSITLFNHAVHVTGPNINMRVALGMALADQGRFDEAIVHLRAALRIKPDDAIIHGELGRTLVAADDWSNAEKHFAIARRLAPQDPDAHYNHGLALARSGRHEAARLAFEDALRLKPTYGSAASGLAETLHAQGENDAALQAAMLGVHQAPQSSRAHYVLATILAALGRQDDALRHLQATVRLDPSHALGQVDLGIALAARGQHMAAKTHFRNAIAAHPGYAKAHYNLGVAMAQDGNHREAAEHLRRALVQAEQQGLAELATKCRRRLEAIAQGVE